MIEMRVGKLATDPTTHQQILLLQSLEGNVSLPLVIGGTEAVSIYTGLTNEQAPRPLTHDLVSTILDHFNAQVQEVHIVDLKDNIFYAELVLGIGDEQLRLDARPSDSIALALKYDAPIYLSEEVLTRAGYVVDQTEDEVSPAGPPDPSQKAMASKETVKEAIEDLLEEVQMEDPGEPQDETEDPRIHLDSLRKRMVEAVKSERYEEAGSIKQEINRVKEQQKNHQD